MGFFDDISKSISESTKSISLPSISIPSISLPSSPSLPSFGSLPGFSWEGMPSIGSLPSIDSIQSSINNAISSLTGEVTGMPAPIAELQTATIGNLTQFQQDFNTQLTSLSTSIQQSLKPFWNTITDLGALTELLSNPKNIIIIVAVVVAIAIAIYIAYKFYWSKVEFGESAVDKYTKRGLEAAKIIK